MTPPFALANWLLRRIATFEGKDFLYTSSGQHSYADLSRAATRHLEAVRAAGVARGDVVAVIGDYSFESIAAFLALIENGNVVVPITTQVDAEVDVRIQECDPDFVWTMAGSSAPRRRARSSAERHGLIRGLQEKGAAGLVLFSSGSTGKPKAMVHDLDRLLSTYESRKARSLTIMVFLMFDHIGGLNTLFTALASGSTIVLPGTRDPDDVCALIAQRRVAILPASPTFLNLVLMSGAAERHDLGSLKIITYGTEPMPDSLLARLRAAFPKTKFLQTFGTSETGITQTSSKSSGSTLIRIEDPSIEHKIVNNELWLRSKTQILGYLNHSMERFTDDGWFRTGDLVEQADDGYIRIVGRLSEMINVGGEKVVPGEVESVLLEMPQIDDCMVYGEPSPITGQVVGARVVLSPSGDAATIRRDVRLHCKDRLAPYKVPVKVNVVERTNFGERFKKIRAERS